MILHQKQTVIAYRCPHCGCTATGLVGSFALGADLFRLKCDCGQSEAVVMKTQEGKIRITVPCIVCPKPHTYLISASLFFEKDIFILGCTAYGVDLCFIGDEHKVSDAIRESNEVLLQLLGEDGGSVEDLKKINGEKDLTDPQVLEIVMFVIHDLADAGAIECRCEDGSEYNVEIHDDCVIVKCQKCGAQAKIPTTSVGEANEFLRIEHLKLL